MSVVQRKSSAVVAERVAVPGHGDMAGRTVPPAILRAVELTAMGVLLVMAPGTLSGTAGEQRGHFAGALCLFWTLMTFNTGDRMICIRVHPLELESGARMIERERGFELLRDMAGCAGQLCLRVDCVRIGVARFAGAGSKVKLPPGILCRAAARYGEVGRCRRLLRGRSGGSEGLVTLFTRNVRVPFGQWKLRLGMALPRKCRSLESRQGMAKVALAVVRLRSEFSAMGIGMARRAGQLAGLESGFAPLGLMAFRAGQRGMLS